MAIDPCRASRLAEVLAREASGDDIYVRQGLDVANVAQKGYAFEALLQHPRRGRFDLRQREGRMSGLMKTELYAPDSGKEPRDG